MWLLALCGLWAGARALDFPDSEGLLAFYPVETWAADATQVALAPGGVVVAFVPATDDEAAKLEVYRGREPHVTVDLGPDFPDVTTLPMAVKEDRVAIGSLGVRVFSLEDGLELRVEALIYPESRRELAGNEEMDEEDAEERRRLQGSDSTANVVDIAFGIGGELLVAGEIPESNRISEVFYYLSEDFGVWQILSSKIVNTNRQDSRPATLGSRIATAGVTAVFSSPWKNLDDDEYPEFGEVSVFDLSNGVLESKPRLPLPPEAFRRVNETLRLGKEVAIGGDLVAVAAESPPERENEGQVFLYTFDSVTVTFTFAYALAPTVGSGAPLPVNFGATMLGNDEFFIIAALSGDSAATSGSDNATDAIFIYDVCNTNDLCQVGVLRSPGNPNRVVAATFNGTLAVTDAPVVSFFNVTDPNAPMLPSAAPSGAPSRAPTVPFRVGLASLRFTDSGAKILGELSVPSDTGGLGVEEFRCSELLEGPSLGSEMCRFTSPSTFSMTLRIGSSLLPSNSLSLRDLLVPDCSEPGSCANADTEAPVTASIEAPDEPAAPLVRFSHPSSFSTCLSTVTIDARGSSNGGGRRFDRFQWEVMIVGRGSLPTRTQLEVNDAEEILELTTEEFDVGDVLEVTLTLTNFLGETGNAATNLRVVPRTSFTVAIAGSMAITVMPFEERVFSATVTPGCDNSDLNLTSLTGQWVYELVSPSNPSPLPVTVPDTLVTNQSLLIVPAFTFTDREGNYAVRFTVTDPSSTSDFSESAVVDVEVENAPLVPILEGCNAVIPASNTPFVIDASRSFNPNVGFRDTNAAEDDVEVVFDIATTGCSGSPAAPTPPSKVFSFTPAEFAGCRLDVTLRMTAEGGGAAGVSPTCVVEVHNGAGPELRLAPYLDGPLALGDAVQIAASVAADDDEIRADWAVVEGHLSGDALLADSADSETSYLVAQEQTFRARAEALGQTVEDVLRVPTNLAVLASGFLPDVRYTFALAATFQPAGAAPASSVSVSFVVNAPPTAGSFSISPSFGDVEVPRNLDAPGWTDAPEDLPLRYRFRARVEGAEAEEFTSPETFLLNPADAFSPHITGALLPLGESASRDRSVRVELEVADNIGSGSFVEAVVDVTAPLDDLVIVAERILDTVSASGVVPALANTDEVVRAVLSAAMLVAEIQGGDDVRIRGFELLQGLLDRGVTVEILACYINLMRGLGRSAQGVEVARKLTETGAIIGEAAVGLRRTTSPDTVILTYATIYDVIAALSSAFQPEVLANATTEDARGLVASTTTILYDLVNLRSTSLVADGADETCLTGGLAANWRSTTFDPTGASSIGESIVGGAVELSDESFAGAGVNFLDNFLFSILEFPEALYAPLGEDFSNTVPLEAGDAAASALISPVQTLLLTLSEAGGVGDGRGLLNDGSLSITLPLGDDPTSVGATQCETLLETVRMQNPNATEPPECLTEVQCGVYNTELAAFEVLPECVATVQPDQSALVCACDFSSPDRRRFLASTVADDDGFSTSESVSLDFGSLVVSSARVVRSTFIGGDGSDDGPRWLVFVVIALFVIFSIVYLVLANRYDQQEMAVTGAAAARSRSLFREWAEDTGVADLTERLAPEVTCIEDVALLRGKSAMEVTRVAEACDLSDAEAMRFDDALAAPIGDYVLMLRERPSEEDANEALQRQASIRPPTFLEQRRGAALHRAGAHHGAAYRHTVASGSNGAKEPVAKGHDQNVSTTDVLDGGMWYGLLLTTPEELHRYEERSTFSRLAVALRHKHEFYDALSLKAGLHPTRFVRVLNFVAMLASALLMNAIVYQVIYPDDNDFCNAFNENPDGCLEDASSLNRKENRCSYNFGNDECSPTEAAMNPRDIVIAAAFALLFIAPFSLLFRQLTDTLLVEAPHVALDRAGREYLRQKDILRQTEEKRARTRADAELQHLRDYPEDLPPSINRVWPRSLGDWVLQRKVLKASREAAALETELEAEYRVWVAQVQAKLVTPEEFSEQIFQHKVFATKLAVRDALPLTKRLIFKQYTELPDIQAPFPQWVRWGTMGFLFAYTIFCIIYLTFFGMSAARTTARAWIVAVIIAELVTAFLLITMRVVVLNVVLPSLVRPDVSVARILSDMPHYSAPALLSRAREDLLPGMRTFLDTSFSDVAEVPERPNEPDAVDPTPPPGPPPEALSPETQHTRNALLQSTFDILEEEGTTTRASTGAPRRLSSALRALPSRSTSKGEAAKVQPRARASRRISDLFFRPSDFDPQPPPTPPPLRKMDAGAVYSPPPEAPPEPEVAPPSQPLRAPDVARRISRSSQKARRGERDLPVGSLANIFARNTSQIASLSEHDAENPGGLGSSATASQPQSRRSSYASQQPTEMDVQPYMGQNYGYVSDVGRQLRRRGCCATWCTRCILLFFACILVLPEPLQEIILEEGIPVGLALVLLVGLNLNLDDDAVEAIIVGAAIVVLLGLSLLFLYSLEQAIHKNVSEARSKVPPPPDQEVSPTFEFANPVMVSDTAPGPTGDLSSLGETKDDVTDQDSVEARKRQGLARRLSLNSGTSSVSEDSSVGVKKREGFQRRLSFNTVGSTSSGGEEAKGAATERRLNYTTTSSSSSSGGDESKGAGRQRRVADSAASLASDSEEAKGPDAEPTATLPGKGHIRTEGFAM